MILINLFTIKNLWAKNSGEQISIIRDAETEKMLRDICYPLFKVANQNNKSLKIYIVNDNSINAFVAGGQNIFINLGLIQKFDNPNVIAGVMAHEIGHIASGHLAKSSEMMNNNISATVIGYLLGVGAIISGQPQLGASIMMGSSHIGNRLALKYTRSQEESADILAIKYLKELNIGTDGFIEIMEYFNQQNQGTKVVYDEYELTHPMSASRIKLVKNETENYKYKSAQFDKKITQELSKSQAKLAGYLNEIESTLKYIQDKQDQNSLLTKSIALYRQNNFKESLEILDKLITESPKDGFLYELKAEFLFNQNNISEAILNYKKATKYLDENSRSLAQISLANAIIQLKTSDEYLLNYAIRNFLEAQKYEDDNALILKQLASAYFLKDNEGKAFLAMAEYYFLLNDCDKAQKNAKEALQIFEESKACDGIKFFNKICTKSDLIRANDILEICKNSKAKEGKI